MHASVEQRATLGSNKPRSVVMMMSRVLAGASLALAGLLAAAPAEANGDFGPPGYGRYRPAPRFAHPHRGYVPYRAPPGRHAPPRFFAGPPAPIWRRPRPVAYAPYAPPAPVVQYVAPAP